MIEIRIPIKPRAKGRPRFTRMGGAYTPKETKDYEEAIAWYVRSVYKEEPVKIPLSVSLVFTFRHKTKRGPHVVRPDIDNLTKAVCDACNGVLWEDDSQIAHMNLVKMYEEEDSVIISAAPLAYQIGEDLAETHPGTQSIQ